MRRRIEPGDRVLRHQEPEPEDEPERRIGERGRSTPVARVVHGLREDVRERLMLIGNDDEDADDEHDADHVPPGGDHVQPRRQPDVEHVDDHRSEQERRVEDVRRHVERRAEPVVHVRRVVEPVVEEHLREDCEAVTDRRSDRDLPDEVEPARRPAPARAAELRRPVVEAARRRVGRCDLGHAERDEGAHEADEEPAPRDGHWPAVLEGDRVRGQAPREDRDDREGDGEVAEPSHGAEQLLRVAQPVEGLLVLRRVVAGRLTGAHTTSQGSPTCLRRVLRPLSR